MSSSRGEVDGCDGSRIIAATNQPIQCVNEPATEATTASVAATTGIEPSNKTDAQSDWKRKSIKDRSIVWDHFEKVNDEKGCVYEVKCNYCSRTYKHKSKRNGTSTLRTHMDACIKNPKNEHTRQKLLSLQPINQEGGAKVSTLSTWKYDYDALRKSIACMIIEDELPFKFVEKKGFRKVMKQACPRFIVPSRWTITRYCFDLYVSERSKLKSFFKDNCQRVCLTTDTWTSIQRINYMCITIHFIDNDWTLHKKILNFVPVTSHKGEYLGKAIETCILDWGLRNVFTITVDNASSNDTAIAFLKKRLLNWGGSVAGCKYLHMRCIAHIINLVVTDGLKDVDPSVKRVRDVVRYIRNSPARLNKFKECVDYEEIESKSSLCLDVATRWNSTYLMLITAEKFEKAFEKYEMDESSYVSDLGRENIPTSADWTRVRKISGLLKIFYEMTLKISGSLYVTANSFFNEISELCGVLKEWKDSDDVFVKGLGISMMAKFEKYWGNPEKMNKLIFWANVFDPCVKFEYLDYSLFEMYGAVNGEIVMQSLKNELEDLFKEYKQKYQPESDANASGCLSNSKSAASTTAQGMKARFKKKKMVVEGGGSKKKTELEIYLNEDLVEDDELDVLKYWKANSERFPILAKMARDILAIPISTVASESVFSTSGRVLDEFRSSLTPKLVECLICAQDWLRDSESETSDAQLEELEKFEKDLPNVEIVSSSSSAKH